jgi:hypothetical protein
MKTDILVFVNVQRSFQLVGASRVPEVDPAMTIFPEAHGEGIGGDSLARQQTRDRLAVHAEPEQAIRRGAA